MKYLLPLFVLLFAFGGVAIAAPYFNSTRTIIPEQDSSFDVGTSTKAYRTAYFDELCLGGDCQTVFPGSGGGEANIGASLGTGSNIYDSKSGVTLRFNSIAAGSNISISTSSNANTLVISSTGGGGSGLATSSPTAAGNVLAYTAAGAGSAYGIATSSLTINAPLTTSGTPGALVGGTNLTLDVDDIAAADLASADFGSFTCNGTTCAIDNSAVSNAMLANSTISGISLGSNLADLTALDTTLSFSGTYNGSTARTIGLNLANANTWTGGQTFANSTTTGTLAIPVGASVITPVAGNAAIDTTSGQFRYSDVTGTSRVFSGYFNFVSGHATTSWTGTTTQFQAPAPAAITVRTIRCETDAGTVGVNLYDGTNRSNYILASTTIGTNTLTTNNTFTAGESMRMDFGTPGTSPKQVACRASYTYDAD